MRAFHGAVRRPLHHPEHREAARIWDQLEPLLSEADREEMKRAVVRYTMFGETTAELDALAGQLVARGYSRPD